MTQGITVVFEEDDHEMLGDLAWENRVSKAEYVRRAVDEYVRENTENDGITVQL